MERDAILIPGGGLLRDGNLPPWVCARFDLALAVHRDELLIPLSAGTTHKAPPLDEGGFPIFESIAGGRYLALHGIPTDRILTENCSYDTIGNAFFSRLIHADPLQLRKILIITSRFHMQRTQITFNWVYGMPPARFSLAFLEAPDEGISSRDLQARMDREKKSVTRLNETVSRIHSLSELHRWLFTEHTAYGVHHRSGDDPGTAIATY